MEIYKLSHVERILLEECYQVFFFYHSNTEGCQLLEIMSGKGS